LLPYRYAVACIQGDHFTSRQTADGQVIGHQWRPCTTQGQHARRAVIRPALIAGVSIQADQAIVLGLYHHHITVGRRRCKHFAVDASAPFFFAGAGVQGNHVTLQGAEHDQAIAQANCTGYRQIEVFFPLNVAVHAVQRHHYTRYVSGVDVITFNRWHQHVVGFALTVTDRAAPLLLQHDFFFEVGQLSRWQFFFAVAAATRGQNDQSQQCRMFPSHHVTHPLWPGHRA